MADKQLTTPRTSGMTLDEAIEHLQAIRNKTGDGDIYVWSSGYQVFNVVLEEDQHGVWVDMELNYIGS